MSADDFLHDYSTASGSDDPYGTRPIVVPPLVRPPADVPRSSQAPPTDSPPTRRSRRQLLLNGLIVLLTLLVLASGGGLYYLDQSYQGKIYPNVSIQGVNVGEMTADQAEAAIRSRYQTFLERPATLNFGEQTWQPTPAELGLSFDFADAAQAAYRAGRNNGIISNLQVIGAIWQNGLDLPLRARIDQNAIRAYVARISAPLEQAPADARLQLNGTSVSSQPARMGRQVLIDQTVQELTSGLATFQPQTLTLRTRDLPPRLDTAAAEQARQQIEAMLQAPLTLTVADREYVWSPEEIALMTEVARVRQDAQNDTFSVALNAYLVERRLRAIADETGRGSVNPRLDWNGGNLRILEAGKPGLRVDEAAAHEQIVAAIASPQRQLALPVREVEPQVTEANLGTLGIKELVSVGRSDFSGSAPYRVTNIGVGMDILNGILIAPDEEFSFNNNIGNIDASNGFVEGYAIIQNRTQLEFGGGICQDSTTVFRAAFWAGLPFTEWHAHSFYISWYDRYALGPQGNGPGMDATIFTGASDLRFVNNTGNWLLMQAYSNPGTGVAEVALYGTKPNRTVELTHRVYDWVPAPSQPVFVADRSQPAGTRRQTDTARGGMTIDVYRTIVEDGVRQEPQLFRTNFKSWPNIFVVNPADLGADGRPRQSEPPAPTPDPAAQPTPQPETAAPPVAPEQPTTDPAAQPPAPEQPAPDPATDPATQPPAPEQPAPEQPAAPADQPVASAT